jgi:hypothetical protein
MSGATGGAPLGAISGEGEFLRFEDEPGEGSSLGDAQERPRGRLVPGYPPSMKRGLRRAVPVSGGATSGRQNPRHASGGPRMAVTGRGETPGVERPGDHRLRPHAPALQPAHDASRLVGPPGVERGANVEQSARVGVAVAPHRQVKVMRRPAPTRGADALPVQRGGKIGVGGHARRAQLVEQEAQMGRCRGAGAMVGSHGRKGVGTCLIW